MSQIKTTISTATSVNTAHDKARRADSPLESELPLQQNVALLHAARERLVLTQACPVPCPTKDDELVVEIRAIGLNPVDWKSIDYNFAIPQLPYIAGRDFAGVVVKAPAASSRLRVGDLVLSPSTDYRDIRKSAFQEYAISTHHNVARIPRNVPTTQAASIGVAYVAAALALGISLGLRLQSLADRDEIDLWEAVRQVPVSSIPADIMEECLSGIENAERPQPGDWIAIYGGSSTSALFISEIARLAGLKVILLADGVKHGGRLSERQGSILVDSHDPARAIKIVQSITKGKLRFAVDTVGKETAGHLVHMLQADAPEDRWRGLPFSTDQAVSRSTLNWPCLDGLAGKSFGKWSARTSRECDAARSLVADWLSRYKDSCRYWCKTSARSSTTRRPPPRYFFLWRAIIFESWHNFSKFSTVPRTADLPTLLAKDDPKNARSHAIGQAADERYLEIARHSCGASQAQRGSVA
ncbi:GroES-like protein, partial [Aureobasidium melanogenum]